MSFLPCLLCGKKLEKRTDKNRKPYFICDACGIQLFVRRPNGIELLERLLRDFDKNEIPFRQSAHGLFTIQALLSEIDGTKKQIDRLEIEAGLIFRDKEKVRAGNLLKTKLENLFEKLNELTK